MRVPLPRQSWMFYCVKRSIGCTFLGALLCLASAKLVLAQESQQGTILPLDCVINPSKSIDLSSAVSGVLESVSVNRSDYVTVGQQVAALESEVEKASVELAQKRAEIESEINAGKINLAFDEREQQRIDSLYRKKAVTYRHKDEADREAELSIWELKQAQDLDEIRELELKRAQAQLRQKIVRSSINGFVVKVYKREGEYIEDQPILRVVQLDPLYVEVIAPMKLFGVIKPGMTAEVVPETAGAERHVATVSVVDPMGDAASGTFGVRLLLPNPQYRLPAGLKCDLRFLDTPVAAAENVDVNESDSAPQVAAVPVVDLLTRTYRLGPIIESEYGQSRVDELASSLQSLGFAARRQQDSVKKSMGYFVLAPGGSSYQDARVAAELLKAKGVKDLQIMTQGDDRFDISLGVLYDRQAAFKHQRRMAKKGVVAEVKDRTSVQIQWWLEVDVEAEVALNTLEQWADEHQLPATLVEAP